MEILFKEKPSPDNVDQPAESQSVPQHNGETVPEISNTDASIQLEATMEILFKEKPSPDNVDQPDSMDQPAESQVDPQHIEEAALETDVPATKQKDALQPDSSDCPEVLQSYVAQFSTQGRTVTDRSHFRAAAAAAEIAVDAMEIMKEAETTMDSPKITGETIALLLEALHRLIISSVVSSFEGKKICAVFPSVYELLTGHPFGPCLWYRMPGMKICSEQLSKWLANWLFSKTAVPSTFQAARLTGLKSSSVASLKATTPGIPLYVDKRERERERDAIVPNISSFYFYTGRSSLVMRSHRPTFFFFFFFFFFFSFPSPSLLSEGIRQDHCFTARVSAFRKRNRLQLGVSHL